MAPICELHLKMRLQEGLYAGKVNTLDTAKQETDDRFSEPQNRRPLTDPHTAVDEERSRFLQRARAHHSSLSSTSNAIFFYERSIRLDVHPNGEIVYDTKGPVNWISLADISRSCQRLDQLW